MGLGFGAPHSNMRAHTHQLQELSMPLPPHPIKTESKPDRGCNPYSGGNPLCSPNSLRRSWGSSDIFGLNLSVHSSRQNVQPYAEEDKCAVIPFHPAYKGSATTGSAPSTVSQRLGSPKPGWDTD